VVKKVAEGGRPILTSDAGHDPRFIDSQSVLNLGLRSILCVPLQIKGRLDGVLYADNRLQAGIFKPEDLEFLAAIADSAAIAIENARLYKIAVEKGRMEQELRMAHQVQESLLPRTLPSIPGWEFEARWVPALEVAGDYYDLIPAADGKLYLVIGDVTDKGMPASLFMVFTRSAIRASVEIGGSLVVALEHSNRMICLESGEGLFVTLFIGCLDTDSGELRYINAGHNPPLGLKAGETEFTRLTRTGIPLGIDSDYRYEERSVQISQGEVLVLYTDGVTEAVNLSGEQFGMARLESSIRQAGSGPAADLVQGVMEAVSGYSVPGKATDDITLLVVRRSSG
jgi:sigma-B regulation protein RsbU (phosphoserine phosphatase)